MISYMNILIEQVSILAQFFYGKNEKTIDLWDIIYRKAFQKGKEQIREE